MDINSFIIGYKKGQTVAPPCREQHVVKVTELPDDEAAETSVVYFCDGKYYTFEYVAEEGGTVGKWTEYLKPSGTKPITENGTHDVKAFESVSVNVPSSGGGGGGGTVLPLKATENGTYDTAYQYEYGTARIDENTEFNIDLGNYQVKKIDAFVPEVLTVASILDLGITMSMCSTSFGVEEENIPLSEDDISLDEDAAFIGISLIYVKNASTINAELGATVFEDNSVYLTNNMQTFVDWVEFTLPVSGAKIENLSFYPVDVDVYIPPTSDETLEIDGPRAGSYSYKDTDIYYKHFRVKSLPTQDVAVELTEAEQTIYADSGKVLRKVTVPALPPLDPTSYKIPCGISMVTYPKTVYRVGEGPSTENGVYRVYYTNGETTDYNLTNSDITGFRVGYENGAGRYPITVTYTENGYTCYTGYEITIGDLCMVTINGNKYGACDGMTWQDWVGTSFNRETYSYNGSTGIYTKLYTIGADGYVWYDTVCQVLYNGNPIAATDTITGGTAYDHNSG